METYWTWICWKLENGQKPRVEKIYPIFGIQQLIPNFDPTLDPRKMTPNLHLFLVTIFRTETLFFIFIFRKSHFYRKQKVKNNNALPSRVQPPR